MCCCAPAVQEGVSPVRAGLSCTRQRRVDVGADGVGSIARKAVDSLGAAPAYAGYIAWRGLFPEKLLSGAAADVLFDRFAFFSMPRSHILGYSVAGPSGEMEPGQRRYNWVWYRPIDSLADALMDSAGRSHRFSLAPGSVSDSARTAMLADAEALLPPQFVATVRTVQVLRIPHGPRPRAGGSSRTALAPRAGGSQIISPISAIWRKAINPIWRSACNG
jgi:hypothetical protein